MDGNAESRKPPGSETRTINRPRVPKSPVPPFYPGKLTGQSLRGRDFEGAVLVAADLSHTNFQDASLRHARLTSARFNYARLVDTDLRGADLRRAKFWNCTLHRANFEGADLRGAQFFDVYGKDVNLDHVLIDDETRFVDTRFYGASLEGVDLSQAKIAQVALGHALLGEIARRVIRWLGGAIEVTIGVVVLSLFLYGLFRLAALIT